ncbi:Asp23/Gls24 family envelope stress response protein [Candidatus Solincola tengchongensis]|uniref:Asp23/Gls24 family envelope stress response protein n=1 Tax=Candidatus Solincola tengchongensis TaxID=2900693 RepID=UPI00257F854C|nr:Asp23/Gls24 family envelope stress response protein [Candidatus Solincola tengchongensis]
MLEAGEYKLRQGVLELIAGIALNSVEGASGVGLRGEPAEEGRKRRNLAKGIKASPSEDGMTLDLEVNMDYGVDFHAVGAEVQRRVKEAVESMTGWPVAAVNVDVVGVNAV